MKKILSLIIAVFLITTTIYASEERFWKNGKYITHTEDCQSFFHDSHMIGTPGSVPGTSSCSCESGYLLEGNKCVSLNNDIEIVVNNNSYEQNNNQQLGQGQRCPSDLILHQNLRAPRYGERWIRNGRYDWYTKTTVREAHILQKHLNRLGFSAGPVDGIIGPKTRAAILRLQRYLGTKADGYVGPKTRALLNNSCDGSLVKEDRDYSKNSSSFCTMEYAPVCAEIQPQCITSPCNPIKQTFSNRCLAEKNPNLSEILYSGECVNVNKDWKKKYSKEELDLARKFAKNFDFYKYRKSDGKLNINFKVNGWNEKSHRNEYLNGRVNLNSRAITNWDKNPSAEFKLNLDYDIETNVKDIVDDLKEVAEKNDFDYKELLNSNIDLAVKFKNGKLFVKVEIPYYKQKILEANLGEDFEEIEKYLNKWVKIDFGAEIGESDIDEIVDMMKKESERNFQAYKEDPFIILDYLGREKGYNAYKAKIDVDGLIAFINNLNSYNSQKEQGDEELRNTLKDLDKLNIKLYLDDNFELRETEISGSFDGKGDDFSFWVNLNLEEKTDFSNFRKFDFSLPTSYEVLDLEELLNPKE